ncbi:MAG TPA: type IV pilus modification protein PilV [Steroidobacteraceae bacterium]|jgi:type IV pilus assembly protein PilV|nr:type IV pilus modification protein PilV [Steroidobacteraceae bacterium]
MTKLRRKRASGFTLVEVLVALVVLSIGLLGIASLQLSSLRWNHGASKRSQATLLAYDILDRMRANPTAARQGEYSTGGTPGTVATADLAAWRNNITASLGPDATGTVSAPDATGTTARFGITITWDDSKGQEDPLSFTLRSQL